MRIAELSRHSGVPIPTIKYYLREGLLPAGERTSRNQVQYAESHLRRLALVRAMVEVGGLSIAAARDVLTRMDSPGATALETLGKAQYAMTPRRDHAEDESWERASAEVAELAARRGWQVRPTNPARQALTEVIATLHRLGEGEYLVGVLDEYAEAAERLAVAEVDNLLHRPGLDSMAAGVVIWTVLGDALLAALRRLAQESESSRRFSEAGRRHTGPPPDGRSPAGWEPEAGS
jgi:DNA-binding transcriptional MerR regulator